jgi:hypothetical protein
MQRSTAPHADYDDHTGNDSDEAQDNMQQRESCRRHTQDHDPSPIVLLSKVACGAFDRGPKGATFVPLERKGKALRAGARY